MPINQRELMDVLAQLAEHRGLRVTVTESMKGAALVGATTFIGGIIFGPVGLAIGGIAGGLTAAANSKNKFRSLADVIRNDMSASQQAMLFAKANNVLRDFAVTDLVMLLPLIQTNQRLNEALLSAAVHFVQNEMNLSLTSS